MSFYDGNKKLADRLICSIQSRKEFKELENEIIPVRQALSDMFPLLKKDEKNIDWLAGYRERYNKICYELFFLIVFYALVFQLSITLCAEILITFL
jgi:hypothetical protein